MVCSQSTIVIRCVREYVFVGGVVLCCGCVLCYGSRAWYRSGIMYDDEYGTVHQNLSHVVYKINSMYDYCCLLLLLIVIIVIILISMRHVVLLF